MVDSAPLLRNINKHGSRSLLANPADNNNDVYSIFDYLGLYDDNNGTPGCLTFSSLVAKMRRFSQIFFQDAVVATDSSYNFCVPDFEITGV